MARVSGAVLLIFAMAVVGPIALFLVGAIWSAGFGWFLSEGAEQSEAQPSES